MWELLVAVMLWVVVSMAARTAAAASASTLTAIGTIVELQLTISLVEARTSDHTKRTGEAARSYG
ncbi:MAG: hypothetical protein ACXVAS_10275, partial [Vulcanimicrobiaceae bacterium]